MFRGQRRHRRTPSTRKRTDDSRPSIFSTQGLLQALHHAALFIACLPAIRNIPPFLFVSPSGPPHPLPLCAWTLAPRPICGPLFRSLAWLQGFPRFCAVLGENDSPMCFPFVVCFFWRLLFSFAVLTFWDCCMCLFGSYSLEAITLDSCIYDANLWLDSCILEGEANKRVRATVSVRRLPYGSRQPQANNRKQILTVEPRGHAKTSIIVQ